MKTLFNPLKHNFKNSQRLIKYKVCFSANFPTNGQIGGAQVLHSTSNMPVNTFSDFNKPRPTKRLIGYQTNFEPSENEDFPNNSVLFRKTEKPNISSEDLKKLEANVDLAVLH